MPNNEVPTGEPHEGLHRHPRCPDLRRGVLDREPPAWRPYRSAELIAIGMIMLPALWWFRTHEGAGFSVSASLPWQLSS